MPSNVQRKSVDKYPSPQWIKYLQGEGKNDQINIKHEMQW